MKNKFFISLVLLSFLAQPCYADICKYFDNFYENYLEKRKVSFENQTVLNLLHKISNEKIIDIETFINNSKTKEDVECGINLIDEEYKDFFENLDFETNYVPNCPLKKGSRKKFKKAHKKYMRRLKKCYLN